MSLHSFYLYTFGCRLNQAESTAIARQLVGFGLKNTRSWQDADLVVVNTCTVTQKADREARQTLRRVRRENPGCLLIAAGCGVGNLKGLEDTVDLWVGNSDKNNVKGWLPKSFMLKKYAVCRGYHLRSVKGVVDKYHRYGKALIKIQEGCSHFCSYCIVPYVRGRPRSVPADEITKQIQRVQEEGVTEVILTGVDLGSYRFWTSDVGFKQANSASGAAQGVSPGVKQAKGRLIGGGKIKNNLVKLLYLILAQTDIAKISFGSMSLAVFDKEFFSLYQPPNRRLATHFHIPLQSGADSVLCRMRRPYTARKAIEAIKTIKENIPDAGISTDIIVGFPGETEEEFEQTLAFLKKIKKLFGRRFTKIHIFRYSKRQGTLAVKMVGQKGWEKAAEETKKKRAEKLTQLFPN